MWINSLGSPINTTFQIKNETIPSQPFVHQITPTPSQHQSLKDNSNEKKDDKSTQQQTVLPKFDSFKFPISSDTNPTFPTNWMNPTNETKKQQEEKRINDLSGEKKSPFDNQKKDDKVTQQPTVLPNQQFKLPTNFDTTNWMNPTNETKKQQEEKKSPLDNEKKDDKSTEQPFKFNFNLNNTNQSTSTNFQFDALPNFNTGTQFNWTNTNDGMKQQQQQNRLNALSGQKVSPFWNK